jgi:hypothetical protein
LESIRRKRPIAGPIGSFIVSVVCHAVQAGKIVHQDWYLAECLQHGLAESRALNYVNLTMEGVDYCGIILPIGHFC